jgi:hypothetical protein
MVPIQKQAEARARISADYSNPPGTRAPALQSASTKSSKPKLERDVAVFLFGVEVALVFQSAQRGDDALAGVRGLNDAV